MKQKTGLKNIWGIMCPPIGYLLLMQITGHLMMLLMILLEITGIFNGINIQISQSFFQFLGVASSAVIGIPIFYIWRERDLFQNLDACKYEKNKRIHFIYPFLMGGTLAGTVNQILVLLKVDQIFPGYENTADVLYSGSILSEIIILAMAVPVVEELIFRGLVMERAQRVWGYPAAMVISAVLFGIYHGNAAQGIYACLLGLVMGYLKEKYHTIIAPILFHMGANLFSVICSDTELLDWISEGQEIYIAVMIVGIAVSVLLFYVIEEQIVPKRIKKDFKWHNFSENNNENN